MAPFTGDPSQPFNQDHSQLTRRDIKHLQNIGMPVCYVEAQNEDEARQKAIKYRDEFVKKLDAKGFGFYCVHSRVNYYKRPMYDHIIYDLKIGPGVKK